MIDVRPCAPSEWQVWRDLRLRALADAPDAFGETLAEAQPRDEASWRRMAQPLPEAVPLIAWDDDRPVGMAGLLRKSFERAELVAMWVVPEARRRGVASALLELALDLARAYGSLDVSLRVSETQGGARALYEAAGFVPTGMRQPLRPRSTVTSETLARRLPPLIMGVVNVTPDSFSDGGEHLDPARAIAHGEQLAAEGADILDIGGEATNPRASAVMTDEELRRVLPVLEGLAEHGLSIDTTKAEVARRAVEAGARFINDVSGGLFDPAMIETVRELGPRAVYIAGHLRGRNLGEVFAAEGRVTWQEIAAELAERIAGLPTRTWIDPGLGFGKGADPEGNVALVRHAGDIAATVGRPIVIGASRKRFVRRYAGLTDDASREAVDAASTLVTLGAVRAGAHVVRVHNVALLRSVLTAYNKS